MASFTQIKDAIRANLNDPEGTFYTEDELNDSLQDGYSDVLFHSRGLIKKTTLSFQASPYYDFVALGATDFMCVIAIFNNTTNRWLTDDLTIRGLDGVRADWELWSGQPRLWAPLSFAKTVILPYMPTPVGTFDLYYAANVLSIPNYASEPLIAADMHSLLENYCTGDLLEGAEEYTKAAAYFTEYYQMLEEYTTRVKNLAKRDLLVSI